MKNNDIVCKCFNVTVLEVLEHIKKNQKMTGIERLKSLKIGTKCGDCLDTKCKKIDIHYSLIFKK